MPVASAVPAERAAPEADSSYPVPVCSTDLPEVCSYSVYYNSYHFPDFHCCILFRKKTPNSSSFILLSYCDTPYPGFCRPGADGRITHIQNSSITNEMSFRLSHQLTVSDHTVLI